MLTAQDMGERLGLSASQAARRRGTTPATAISDSTQSRRLSSQGRKVTPSVARMRSMRFTAN